MDKFTTHRRIGQERTTDRVSSNRDRILGCIRARGWLPVEIARRLRLSRSYLCMVFAGERRPPKVQQRIAALVSMKPVELFGEFLADELNGRAA